jgi:hypothetical protein
MPTAPPLRFIEFIDLLLARLYDRDHGSPGALFDLNEIAQELSPEVPEAWTLDAAKFLQSRGLAMPLITFGGVTAQLTGEGRAYVEEERGTGIIRKYHESPQVFVQHVNIHGDNNQTVVGHEQKAVSQSQVTPIEKEREPAFKILREIDDKLDRDDSLSQSERDQIKEDLEYIREQLKRREPNRSVLAALLAPLSQITSIASQIVSLVRLLNA